MIDEGKYTFRNATTDDIDFLAEVIVEAKKGVSNMVGMANLFDLSVEDFRGYIKQMLEEEIGGCDLSVSSFIVAEYEGKSVAAFGGWVEGENEDNMPSSILKSNLIGFIIPLCNVLKAKENGNIISDLQVEKEMGAYQLEYGYTIPEHRGHHLIGRLIELHEKKALASPSKPSKMQVLVYDNNEPAIKAYTKQGFRVVRHYESNHPDILKIFPHNRELLLEKQL